MRAFTTVALVACAIAASGCLTLFHVTVGDIDATKPDKMRRFEVELKAGGFDENAILEYISDTAYNIVDLGSMGPRTGRPLRKPSMGGSLIEELYKKCPSGNITGLLSTRENKYYFIYQTEIIRVSGYCILED